MLGKRSLACLPALFFLPVVLAPALNHDVAALLDFSERWLDGEALYSRLIDANPPLIFALNLVPAALARYASLEPVTALLLCVLIYGAWCGGSPCGCAAARWRDRSNGRSSMQCPCSCWWAAARISASASI
jgi:hypothetical protein